MKESLLLYNAYQEFYQMANHSKVFATYCQRAFGADFSQDGFSDKRQIDAVLGMVKVDDTSFVLDAGCGNGKMLEYIHRKFGANIYGFDYLDGYYLLCSRYFGIC